MSDYLDLFGEDPAQAQASARALAEAMRRRRAAGTVASIIGGPFAQAGKAFLGDAANTQNDLGQAGMFRGQQLLRRQDMARRGMQDAIDNDFKERELGLKREALLRPPQEKEPKPFDADALRREFQGNKTFKDVEQMAGYIESIRKAPKDGTGDLSLIYSFVKMLDPGSVVREGEIALSRSPTPLLEQLTQAYGRRAKGQLLDPELRARYVATADALFKAQVGRLKAMEGQYRKRAERAGANPEDVIFDYGFGGPDAPADGASAAPAPAPAASNLPRRKARIEELKAAGKTAQEILQTIREEGLDK